MKSYLINKIRKILPKISKCEITFEDSFFLAQACSFLINSKRYVFARNIIILVLDNWDNMPISSHCIWGDLVELVGFYPYLSRIKNSISNNLTGEIRFSLHRSENIENKYFHEEQLSALKILDSDKNLVLSAPTSFGKSLLIEEIIASGKYSNIVIIQPTLALLDETRKKLKTYSESYKIIIRTSQEPDENKKNIFLFTAERVNEYKYFNNVDFIILDEFYKISGYRDDERSASLNNAFYYLWRRFKPKFYMLGPNIDGISDGFEEKFNAIFYKTSYSLVRTENIDIYKDYGDFGASNKGKKYELKEKVLFDLLLKLRGQQTIIYCSSPSRVNSLSYKFYKYLESKESEFSEVNYSLSEWVEKYVYDDWFILSLLKFDIGIHDGTLPKHITSSIINYFNQGKIKFIFCTSTIIEGVNTSAKNVIYFDSHKGNQKDIDYFDYSNIKGRAGRMMQHYTGKVYNFNPPPNREKVTIDIPFFEQNPIKDETLIQLDNDDVKNKESSQYLKIYNINKFERKVIKDNGVSVFGQKNIIDILRNDFIDNKELIIWDKCPNYEQLKYILTLCWNNLTLPSETIRPMTISKLVKLTFDYGLYGDIKNLINSTFEYNSRNRKKDPLNSAIRECFQIQKHWFQYKIPKWLRVCNELQKLIAMENNVEPGNYLFYAMRLENDLLSNNLSLLLELSIPASEVRKLEKRIPNDIQEDAVLNFINDNKLFNDKTLLSYEREKILENI